MRPWRPARVSASIGRRGHRLERARSGAARRFAYRHRHGGGGRDLLGATIYAATLSAADVAAHTLAPRTAGVAYAVPTALLQAAMIRMARAETLGDPAIRRAVTASGLGLSLVAGASLFGALMLGARPLADSFFNDGAEGLAAAGLAASLLMLLGVMELMAGTGSAAAGLLRDERTRVRRCSTP